MKEQPLRAPFPWFGGKSRAAHLIWERFGDVPNYIEPFAGSLAVLLSRPTPPRIETVNDLDCYLSNFWRAVQAAPDEVAKWADWPVNEADLHARSAWLLGQEEFRAKMRSDPDYFDAKIAGWWVWGVSAAIGGAGTFCSMSEPNRGKNTPPNMHHYGNGLHAKTFDYSVFRLLRNRLRHTRIVCGDWRRVLTGTPTGVHPCGILLDPPYADGDYSYVGQKRKSLGELQQQAVDWAIEHGARPALRIAVCGYEGTVTVPGDWDCVEWRTEGGHSNTAKDHDNKNKYRERIWFSPHCLKAVQRKLL